MTTNSSGPTPSWSDVPPSADEISDLTVSLLKPQSSGILRGFWPQNRGMDWGMLGSLNRQACKETWKQNQSAHCGSFWIQCVFMCVCYLAASVRLVLQLGGGQWWELPLSACSRGSRAWGPIGGSRGGGRERGGGTGLVAGAVRQLDVTWTRKHCICVIFKDTGTLLGAFLICYKR